MRSSIRSGIVLVLTLLACAPERAPSGDARAAAPGAPDAERLRADVVWLADDARQGRRAGTEPCRAAADWIAMRFQSLGLEPAGSSGFLQEFDVPLPPRVGETSLVRVETARGSRMVSEWKGVLPLFCSEGGAAEGPLVFCGYGLESLDQQWNDFGERDLAGAIAVVLRGVPPASELLPAPEPAPGEPAHEPSFDGSIFQKVMNAKHRGAIGVIVLQEEGATEPLAFDPTQPARAKIPALSAPRSVLEGLLGELEARALCARAALRNHDDFGPPDPALVVRIVADVQRGKGPAHNVLARLSGLDPARTVVVGAHFDHLGLGGEGSLAADRTGEVHNGADDNASGTAAVLELARVMAAGPRPAGDVVFALWSGEELGLLGSEYWCEHPTVALLSVRANLNLDMVGRARPPGDTAAPPTLTVLGAGTATPFEGWLAPAGERAGLKLLVNRSGQGIGGSDHMSFMNRKIPVLHFFTGLHADYHRPGDDSDKVDSQSIARIVAFGAELVARIQAERQLAWNEQEPETKAAADRRPIASVSGAKVWFGSIPDYSWEGPGMRLSGTSAGGPAQKAGMLAGDVLEQVGDVRIDTIHDFMYALSLYKPGDVVVTRFRRGEATEEVRITLSTRAAQ